MKKTMGDKRDGEMKREGERDIRRTMKGSGGYD
jgi:tmRNA-binding protein